MSNGNSSTAIRVLVACAAFVVIVAGMRAASALLVPMLLSLFIAILAMPPLTWLRRRRVPTALAILIVVFAMMAVLVGLGLIVGRSMDDFARDLPIYQGRVATLYFSGLEALQRFGLDTGALGLRDRFDPSAAIGFAGRTLSAVSSALTNLFLIIMTVVFILLETAAIPDKLRAGLARPDAWFERFGRVGDNIQSYMLIKTAVSAATGLVIGIWLAILGVDYPVLWGLLAFMLNYVPNIGSILAAVPAMLLALVQLGPTHALLSAAGFLAVNVVMGNVVEPQFMGRGVGLSTLVVFVSLIFWGWVLGPVGMILSVPLTMTVKIALEASEETRWLAVLLGSRPDSMRPAAEAADNDDPPDSRT